MKTFAAVLSLVLLAGTAFTRDITVSPGDSYGSVVLPSSALTTKFLSDGLEPAYRHLQEKVTP